MIIYNMRCFLLLERMNAAAQHPRAGNPRSAQNLERKSDIETKNQLAKNQKSRARGSNPGFFEPSTCHEGMTVGKYFLNGWNN